MPYDRTVDAASNFGPAVAAIVAVALFVILIAASASRSQKQSPQRKLQAPSPERHIARPSARPGRADEATFRSAENAEFERIETRRRKSGP